MRLTNLSIRGYHGFRTLELSFPERGPTVLIGENGAGKSTVLDAIALFLNHVVTLASSPPQRRKHGASVRLPIPTEEVNRESREARLLAQFVAGEERLVALATSRLGSGAFDVDDRLAGAPLDDFIYSLIERLSEDRHAAIPVLAYYRPNRGVGLELGKKAKPPEYPQLGAYKRALDAQVGPFQEFVRWFRAMEDQENQERARRSPTYRNPRLQAARSAIERFLSALEPNTFKNLRVVRDVDMDTGAELPTQLLIDKGSVSLPLSHLSDGERAMLLLVADLAMRLVVANPAAVEPLHGTGIVLIDEMEMHLHPGWQRAVLPGLMEAFPSCQFIATTHSPQVLSTLEPASVVMLEGFRRVEAPLTYGRDTNSILRDVMGTPARPQETAEKLERIAKLIDAEKYEQARSAIEELSRSLGTEDPEIVRLQTLTHFLSG